MDLPQAVIEASSRLQDRVRRTPVEFSAWLSERSGCQVYLKLENWQKTGSFKLRGAFNKLLALSAAERSRGVVAASSGNHGMAVAHAAAAENCAAVVYVPDVAEKVKVEAIQRLGAEVRVFGSDCVLAEGEARRFASSSGASYLSPYNDPAVVAGQGTIGAELHQQLDELDAVFVALGGGGLISGIGAYLKSVRPKLDLVAASARHSAVMHHSLEAGKVLQLNSLPTWSDGTAGGVEQDAMTFPLCQELIDRSLLVEEDDIRVAVQGIVQHHHMLIEGSAGVPVAAFLGECERYRGQTVVLLMCGANIGLERLREILNS
jgi:threonine dehydratase